jgi:hypothetical protein
MGAHANGPHRPFPDGHKRFDFENSHRDRRSSIFETPTWIVGKNEQSDRFHSLHSKVALSMSIETFPISGTNLDPQMFIQTITLAPVVR